LQQEAGSRFLINAILEALHNIARDPASGVEVAIIPEMKIASGDGVVIENGDVKLALTGVGDFGLVRYRVEHRDFILGLTSSNINNITMFSDGCGLLVDSEVKHHSPDLLSCLPEAIGQALVWLQLNKYYMGFLHVEVRTGPFQQIMVEGLKAIFKGTQMRGNWNAGEFIFAVRKQTRLYTSQTAVKYENGPLRTSK